VVRFWGSREKDYQRMMVQGFDDEAAARESAERLVREKVRGGYRVVSGYAPEEVNSDG
jgi:predicted DNA-binding WGR domain protein